MSREGRLDPHEVLAHLHSMGYCNITAKQLTDFVRDLKQLIKDDLQQSSEEKENISNVKVTTVVSADRGQVVCTCPQPGNPEKGKEYRPYRCYSEESLCSSSRSVDAIGSIESHDNDGYVHKQKQTKPQHSSRPQSSFIRPWRLHPPSTSTAKGVTGCPSQKSDPVKMYQKYKEIWSQQKIPGENNHSQLRWAIREKMLGQDPQPRPTSQASTGDHHKGSRNS